MTFTAAPFARPGSIAAARAVVRVFGSVCLLALAPGLAIGRQAASEPTTLSATIEGIDQATRTVTLKAAQGATVSVKAPDQMEGFNSLRVGDLVTATYQRAIAVSVRKAGDKAPSAPPVTMTERKDRAPGSQTRRQETISGTVQALDAKAPSLTVKNAQGSIVLAVDDPKLVQSVKVGDTVDVTYFESLLIKVARAPK